MSVHAKDPADCVVESVHESSDLGFEDKDLEDDQNLTAALDAGVDEISPVKRWDVIMLKYRGCPAL